MFVLGAEGGLQMDIPKRTDNENEALLEVIKDLYISMRKRWILQQKDGYYTTMTRFPLHDDMIRNHLKGKNTIGVFARSDYVKFLTFDVDIDDLALQRHKRQIRAVYGVNASVNLAHLAKWTTLKLIDVLVSEFGISRKNLLTSFSGSKGYHVSLFFNDNKVTERKARRFYEMVLDSLGASESEIEFRPMNTMGVKPPLGKNKKTNNYCHLVDLDKLEYISDNTIFDVVKVDSEEFLEQLKELEDDYKKHHKEIQKRKLEIEKQQKEVKKEQIKQKARDKLELEPDQQQDFEDVVDEINIEIPVGFDKRMEQIIQQQMLLDETTPRHNTTYLLSVYLKDKGKSQTETNQIVQRVIYNTYLKRKYLIDSRRSLEFCLGEVTRLCEYVYKAHKTTKRVIRGKTIRLYKNEILGVLDSSRKPLMIQSFAMLLHSKKFADKDGIFYMTYENMEDYGVKGNWKQISSKLDKLESNGFLEIVARNRVQENTFKKLPNLYKIKVVPDELQKSIEFDVDDVIVLEEVAINLITENEIKKILTPDVFKKQWSKHYKKKQL